MISVDDAVQITLRETRQIGKEKVDLLSATGYVLAEDVCSDIDMPPFPKSSMDGYAFKAADCKNGSVVLEVVGVIPAGVYPDLKIESGQAAKIMTGAPMPAGADCVQMVEKTEAVADDKVKILEPAAVGHNVALQSEIIKANSTVLRVGTVITPAVIGVLATVGKDELLVCKRPTVAILVTGDELVEVNSKPGAGQIRNSNGYALYHQVKQTGAQAEMLGIAPDNIAELTRMIERGLKSDVLLISGGVSMGDYDFVEEILGQQGVHVHYNKINIKPGKPTVFACTKTTHVFGLPGNPVSASTVFEVLVKPTLRKMMGFPSCHSFRSKAVLQTQYETKTKRENFHPARTVYKDDKFWVTPLQSRGSADVLAFAASNSFMITTVEKQVFAVGDTVEVMLREEFWQMA